MDEALVESMREVEDRQWWYRARREILLAVLHQVAEPGDTLLDVGCGTGSNLTAFSRSLPVSASGVDAARICVDSCAARGLDVVGGVIENLPCATSSADIVVATDVLEHVAEEGVALREVSRVMRPGGSLLLTVPALPALWGPHDVLAHHKRRYRRPELLSVVSRAGFEIVYCTYFNALLLGPAAVVRVLEKTTGKYADDQRVPSGPLNALMYRVFLAERAAVSRRLRMPLGLSLLLLAKKR